MRWKIVIKITLIATYFSDYLIRNRKQYFSFKAFGKMPEGSLGHSFYATLKKQGLNFKPNLIRHDLKHILLNYSMEIRDELRICAFLIGNRSYNKMSMLYLLICTAIVPEIIPQLKKDFKRGRRSTTCLKNIELQEYVHLPVITCRKIFNIHPVIQ